MVPKSFRKTPDFHKNFMKSRNNQSSSRFRRPFIIQFMNLSKFTLYFNHFIFFTHGVRFHDILIRNFYCIHVGVLWNNGSLYFFLNGIRFPLQPSFTMADKTFDEIRFISKKLQFIYYCITILKVSFSMKNLNSWIKMRIF